MLSFKALTFHGILFVRTVYLQMDSLLSLGMQFSIYLRRSILRLSRQQPGFRKCPVLYGLALMTTLIRTRIKSKKRRIGELVDVHTPTESFCHYSMYEYVQILIEFK